MAAQVAMTLIGGAVSAYSAYQKGKAQEANHKYNAKVAEAQAEQGQMEARENASRAWKNQEQQMATARARLATTGSVSNAGAPLEVMGELGSALELDIQDNYRSSQVQRSSLMQSAKISRWQGKQAKRAGKLMVLSSIAGTAMKLSSNFKTGIKTGALKPNATRAGALMGAF